MHVPLAQDPDHIFDDNHDAGKVLVVVVVVRRRRDFYWIAT